VRHEVPDQLFERVAAAVAVAPSAFRVHIAENDGRAELAEARQRARVSYDLAGELSQAEPSRGWQDDAIPAAEIVLGNLADGWALASVVWPDGIPDGSLPDLAKLAWYVRESGLADWCGRLGHPTTGPQSQRRWRLERRRSGHRNVHLGSEPLVDFRIHREREQPDWSRFDEANRLVASQLGWWLSVYRLVMPYWEGDPGASSDVDADEAAVELDLSWEKTTSALAWARSSIDVLQERGGQAEAIAGVGVVGRIARFIYLASTAADTADRSRLHLPPLDAVDREVAEFRLEEWMATVANATPE
jgi:hypothetical protein